MQELTPRAVPSAVRMASRLCTTNFQISFLLIVVLSPFFFTLVCLFLWFLFSLFPSFLPFQKSFSFLSDASDKFSFFPSFLPFRKPFFWKPYFSVLNLSFSDASGGFFFLPDFFPFQKSFLSLSDASDKFSFFPSLLPFSENLSFRILPEPPSLFSSSFSLSLDLISLSIPFGAFGGF